MTDTIRCLCAKCRAFTEHTIPGGKCTVCDAGIPTGKDIASMSVHKGRRERLEAALLYMRDYLEGFNPIPGSGHTETTKRYALNKIRKALNDD